MEKPLPDLDDLADLDDLLEPTDTVVIERSEPRPQTNVEEPPPTPFLT